ncbi:translocation/assembly module TamB domain-containing protein [Snodgrassella sp. M0351]|uniref:translocation/assembly module TamB domain-containing protein n=1 Tax=Snodgrassella sp. M0351 TaxID=2751012 RepID=UPI0018DCF76E|nr:translocation/assembly module TamB domain-containing protein [Snodgrassella sp. M0351]MBI0165379.1 translocation/assembly module TamB domain-containing protein [Snodgrassella sp. M0351]
MAETTINSGETPVPATPPSVPPRKPRWKSWLKTSLYSLLALFIIIVALLCWLIGTESGLRFGVHTVPKWFGVHIQTKNLTGTIWRGFSGTDIHVSHRDFDLSIDKVRLDWNNRELWRRRFHVRLLDVGKINYIDHSVPKPKPVPTLPNSISLPLQVIIDNIQLGGFTLGKKETPVLLASQASYTFDYHKHQLILSELNTPWQSIHGNAAITTQTPFILSGQLNGSGTIDKTAVESAALIKGSLQQPDIFARLDGGNIHFRTHAIIRPYALQLNHKIISLNLQSRHINPAAFNANLPFADLNLNLDLAPVNNGKGQLVGHIKLGNEQPLAYNDAKHGGLPVRSIEGDINIDNNGKLILPALTTRLLQQGQIITRGNIDSASRQLDINSQLLRIYASDALATPLPGSLNGHIRVSGSFNGLITQWLLSSEKGNSEGSIQIITDEQKHQQTLILDKLNITPNGGGSFNAKGSLALYQNKAIQLAINSNNFNPAKVNSDFPAGSINGHINVNGQLGQQPAIQADMLWHNSILSGAPLSGKAVIRYRNQHLEQANINLNAGPNRIVTNGSFGKKGDKLNLDINAPNLGLFGLGMKGLLSTKGFIAGEPKKITANLTGAARNLQITQLLNINQLDFKLVGSPDINQPLLVNLNADHISIAGSTSEKPTVINSTDIKINGRGSQHQLQGSSNLTLDGKAYHFNLSTHGGLDQHYQWRGRVNALDISGALNLKLLNPIQLEAGTEHVSMQNARWAALNGNLTLNNLNWDKNKGLITRGSASNLALHELHNVIELPVEQNLIIGGDWNFSYSRHMQGYLKLYQQGGDITLPQHQQKLGLQNVRLDAQFQNGHINNHLSGITRYGTTDATLVITPDNNGKVSTAPISGRIKLDSPDLSTIRNLLPIGMQLKGNMHAEAGISGHLNEPLLNGTLTGNNLYYRDQANGTILENGNLKSHFQGRRWLIDNLSFARRDGTIKLSGVVDMTKLTPDINVTAHFDHYNIFDQINRRLTISGNTQLLYTIAHGIVLNGKLKVDKGLFGMQKSGMPQLDDDVVVLGREKTAEQQRPTPIRLNLDLDMNDAFRFSAEGIDVLLGGQLTATANPGSTVQIVGTVNVVRGQYKAYGQDLVIQHGSTISFVGPMDNPNLKIRAKRRYSQVGAGVEALGRLDSPRINLIANEAMSEKDKLSWLILNRPSSGSAGDEAAIAAAASAWLAGGLNDKLGLLDEIGLTSQQTRNSQTGEMNPAEQAITIGKHLSNNLYISYLYGIESATQTVSITYQISRALQSIVRIGTGSAGGEIRYTHRFD